MKISISTLKKIIKEEIENTLKQDTSDPNYEIAKKFVENACSEEGGWTSAEEWCVPTKHERYNEKKLHQQNMEYLEDQDVIEYLTEIAKELNIKESDIDIEVLKQHINSLFFEKYEEEVEAGVHDDEDTKRWKKDWDEYEYRDWVSGSDPSFTGPKPKRLRSEPPDYDD